MLLFSMHNYCLLVLNRFRTWPFFVSSSCECPNRFVHWKRLGEWMELLPKWRIESSWSRSSSWGPSETPWCSKRLDTQSRWTPKQPSASRRTKLFRCRMLNWHRRPTCSRLWWERRRRWFRRTWSRWTGCWSRSPEQGTSRCVVWGRWRPLWLWWKCNRQ